ncbi:MAG: Tex family protein [Candidatus Absconditabacterales bacterium]
MSATQQQSLVNLIALQTGMAKPTVEVIIGLLDEGNTVPFIARYRKELTQGATDEQLRDFADIYSYTKNLEARKLDIIRLINEKGLLTDELRKEIMDATTLARVEDLYRPYKEKKLSKASIAKAKGLSPLAEELKKAVLTKSAWEELADQFIIDTGDVKTSVKTRQEAIQGALDIIAEEVSDHPELRDEIRSKITSTIELTTKPTKTFDEKGTYKIYGTYTKKLAEMPSYAYLAVCRAEDEKQITISLGWNMVQLLDLAARWFIPKNATDIVEYLHQCIEDGFKRLLLPSLERELRSDKKRWSDESAIKLFGENLRQLLLTPPVRGKVALGFDPGYRTGCKLAVVDPTGKFLAKDVIYMTLPMDDMVKAEKIFVGLIEKYGVELIMVGNGTGSRESATFIAGCIKKYNLTCQYMVVSEAGASVYSASALAQKEYPDLDVTVRGAISIAHRVQDPLAELTKIDPKAIGVGQYQHDVDQKLLAQKLDERVEDVVNGVGVDLNSASATLLQYIAGLTPAIASNVVAYRDENGPFKSKAELKKVKGLGPKAYEQCVGFLRIHDGKEPLDATGIHPEIYSNVYEMLEKELGIKKAKLKLPLEGGAFIGKGDQKLSELYGIGVQTLQDVLTELARPGRDPRNDLTPPVFASNVLEVKDLEVGMKLQGVVRNITDFGAFVDIGLHNDGLVHKSQMADYYVASPMDVVSLGQQVTVRVVEIDHEREKVSLSMKGEGNTESTHISRPAKTESRPKIVVDDESTETGYSNFGNNIMFIQKK